MHPIGCIFIFFSTVNPQEVIQRKQPKPLELLGFLKLIPQLHQTSYRSFVIHIFYLIYCNDPTANKVRKHLNVISLLH